MAGRGRGTLISEILLQESAKSADHDSMAVTDSSESNIIKRPPSSNNNTAIGQRKSPSPLGLLGLGVGDNPLPSGRGGLMTPSHFMKPSQPGIQKPSQSQLDDLQSSLKQSEVIKEAPTKTQAYQNAEQYLNSISHEASLSKSSTQFTNPAVQKSSYDHKTQGKPVSSVASYKSQSTEPQPGKSESEQAEAEWQRFKLQRQINRILSKITKDDLDEVVADLKFTLEGNALSDKFPQYSEWKVVVETLIDKSIESDDFKELASLIIKKLAEYDITKFQMTFPGIISSKINEVVKVSASDNVLTNATKRLCKLLGNMFITPVEDDSRFHSAVLGSIQDCVEQWTYPDGIGDEVQGFQVNKAETYAYAVKELFDQIAFGEFEEDRVNELVPEMKRMLELIKESVLNENLPRVIREVYLDTLLLNAKWYRYDNVIVENDEKRSTTGSVGKRNSECHHDINPANDLSDKQNLMLDLESLSTQSEQHVEDQQLHPEISEEKNFLSNLKDENVDLLSCKSDDNESQNTSVIVEDEVLLHEKFDNINTKERSLGGENVNFTDENKDNAFDSYSDLTDEDTELRLSDDQVTDEKIKPSDDITSTENKDPYHNVRIMMKNLRLEDQMQRFESNFIRDAVLSADRDVFKGILKEAEFPAGLIYEICVYLDDKKALHEKDGPNSPKPYVTKQGFGSPNPKFQAPEFKFGETQVKERTSVEKSEVNQRSSWRQKETGPKKKLLGIGRGGNTEGSKEMRGVKSQGVRDYDKIHRYDRSYRPGPDRQGNGSNGGGGGGGVRNKENARKWQGTNEKGSGYNSGYYNKRESQASKSSGFDRRDNESPHTSRSFEDSRQIGKVQPMKKSREDPKFTTPQSTGLKFDGIPSGCLHCGDKNHFAHDCSNSKAMFFGQ